MTPLRRARRRRSPLLAASLAASVAGAIGVAAGLPAVAGAVGELPLREGQGRFDQRAAATAQPVATAPAQRLARSLGPQAVVQVDPVTGTPRQVARTDGTLTEPSADAPAEIALRYVRANRDLFKLSDADLAALDPPSDYVSIDGTHHLRWTQRFDGVPVLGAELRAHVTADGRLLAVQGSPLPGTTAAPSGTARLDATGALAKARRDAGAGGAAPAVTRSPAGATQSTGFADGSSGRLVVFAGPSGPRLAWQVTVPADSTHQYVYVLDAATGAVLKRENNVFYASGRGTAWEYRPDGNLDPATFGQALRDYPNGWVAAGSARLFGDNVHVYSDVNDDDLPQTSEEVPKTGDDAGLPMWNWPFQRQDDGYHCRPVFPCSWVSFEAGRWRANREQNAAQVFWFVNRFHDHLADTPIGFTPAAGNFEGADRVLAESDDGANLTLRLSDGSSVPNHPDDRHLNNANMSTPPDGRSPRMQMYLFMAFGATDPTIDSNGGDDASVVYHEYTHGLSSRLVTDSTRAQALNSAQSGAMGEGWSDWYALDFLVADDLQPDTVADGEIRLAASLDGGALSLRRQALDCPLSTVAPECRRAGGGTGGYTYADYGSIGGGPEVHDDGEIWAQTLWDLRRAVGAETARGLITRAMELSPPEPTFLDMRNAILQADQAATGGALANTIWQVFAARGMGYFASALDANDTSPVADFDTPPVGTADATFSGTVTDAASGAPVPDATVRFPGRADLVARTDANGRYALSLHQHAYPYVVVSRGGYDDVTLRDVAVAAGANTRDVALRRNWALSSGTTAIESFTGPDYTSFGCGPGGAIDGSAATGWGSFQPAISDPARGVAAGPRLLVLRLPQAVDVTSFAIDPSATCGDDETAALGRYELETSQDGSTYTPAASGTFGPAHNGRSNPVAATAGSGAAARWVRLRMLSPQGPTSDPTRSASEFMDVTELSIYGRAVRPADPPGPPAPPDPGPPATPRPPEPRPAPPPAADRSAPRIAGVGVRPARGALRALLGRGGGLKLTLRCTDEPCRVSATVTLPAATARKLGLTRRRGGAPFVLARASSRGFVEAGRTTTLTLRVSRAVARRLARVARLTPTIAITATDRAGNPATRTLRPRLRR
ncbi:M36 family metallopeptidase [Conexibacter woesei]|uniref:M36 family metallopeptidase n=1 Tax=Conexibacter woesei TaxID=191495 RepID=UPI0003125279|nr:M36 family metallopeptidase [Conexibacter woesei]